MLLLPFPRTEHANISLSEEREICGVESVVGLFSYLAYNLFSKQTRSQKGQ
jgi:hypothetical protein